MKHVIGLAFALAGLGAFATPALAWDGIQSGQISAIDVVADGRNFGLRVYLDGREMCGASSAAWGYMNSDASNYQASVAALYTAWLNHRSISLWMNKTNGVYCEIGYMQVR